MTLADKRAMRDAIRHVIAALDPAARAREEALLRERLRACVEQVPSARTGRILAYLPLPDEPDLLPLLREWAAADRLCLPRMLEGGTLAIQRVSDLEADLADGPFGVREPGPGCAPVPPVEIQCVIVPGRAFTPYGERLGRGKGYYDRLLASVDRAGAGEVLTVAPAFDCQIVPALPTEAHDQRVRIVLSALRCFEY